MNISMKSYDNGEIQKATIQDGDEEYLFENKHRQAHGKKTKELTFSHNSLLFLTLTAFQESSGGCQCRSCPGKLAFSLRGEGIDYQTSIHIKCGTSAVYETRLGTLTRIVDVNLTRLAEAGTEGSHTICQALPPGTEQKLRVFEPVLLRLVEHYKRRAREDSDFGAGDAFSGGPNQSAGFWGTLGRAACWAAGGAGTALCCGATALAGCIACGAGFGAAASICSDNVGD